VQGELRTGRLRAGCRVGICAWARAAATRNNRQLTRGFSRVPEEVLVSAVRPARGRAWGHLPGNHTPFASVVRAHAPRATPRARRDVGWWGSGAGCAACPSPSWCGSRCESTATQGLRGHSKTRERDHQRPWETLWDARSDTLGQGVAGSNPGSARAHGPPVSWGPLRDRTPRSRRVPGATPRLAGRVCAAVSGRLGPSSVGGRRTTSPKEQVGRVRGWLWPAEGVDGVGEFRCGERREVVSRDFGECGRGQGVGEVDRGRVTRVLNSDE
jgi:hypothetical protein